MAKICTACNKPGKFHRNKATKDGLGHRCADCIKAYHGGYYLANRKRILERGKNWAEKNHPRVAFALYKRTAKPRGLAFELTMDQFMSFWGKPCFYTGRPIASIGRDRVDNAKGYVMGNVVPCCLAANKAKMQMSHNEFVRLCAEFVQLHGHRNTPVSTQEAHVNHGALSAAV